MKKFTILTGLLAFVTFYGDKSVFAQDANSTDSQTQIKLLQEKLDLLEQKQKLLERQLEIKQQAESIAEANYVSAAKLNEIEQRQKVLERQLEIEHEAAAEKAKTTPVVTANSKDGFSIKSPDGDNSIRFRGLLQADARSVSGQKNTTSDTFLLRRVRPIIEGTVFRDVDYKIVPDFGEGKTSLQDAYLDFKYFPEAKLQAGRFKVPFGLERLQSSSETLFNELSLASNLTPNYDLGLALHSDSLFNNKLSYALGIFNGAVDNASSDTDTDNGKEFAARVFYNPWKGGDIAMLDGLGVGFAATFGTKEGTATASSLPTYKTSAQNTFYSYRSGALADGDQVRYSPQFYYSYGSFGLLGEYITSMQTVSRNSNSDQIQNKGWQLAASYVLTGEAASYKGVVPKTNFDPAARTWGAVEVVGRVSQLDIDSKAFPTYADPTKSASSAQAFGAGVNWYWNKNVKWALDFERTAFQGGAVSGDRDPERAIIARVQVAF